MSTGRTNAVIQSDSYRFIGKEVTITFGGYKTFTSAASYYDLDGSSLFGFTSGVHTIDITEKERRYGYYQGKRSYTTGDWAIQSGSCGVTTFTGGYRAGLSGSLGANEYILAGYGRGTSGVWGTTAGYGVIRGSETSGSITFLSNVSNDASKLTIGDDSNGNNVYAIKATTLLGSAKSTTYKVPYWNIILNEFDMGLVE